MMNRMSVTMCIVILFNFLGFSQLETHLAKNYTIKEPDSVLFEQVEYKGKKALHLKKMRTVDKDKGPDTAYLNNINFTNGTIECDIASDIFTGIAFRVKDGATHECIYFRPFNSGTPKHKKTVQYVAKGSKYTWFYLRKNYPGLYESGADIENNEWFHVKLVVKDTQVKVYVNNSLKPVLVVDDMKYKVSNGSVGLWSWDGYFANLKITNE